MFGTSDEAKVAEDEEEAAAPAKAEVNSEETSQTEKPA
jgi:hypothetical protein